LTNVVTGAQTAQLPTATWAASARRVLLVFIALALAITLVAIEAPTADAARGNEAQRVISRAKSHIGAKFRLGTEGMRYFDCSGFVFRVYTQSGLLNRIGGNRKRAAGYYAWFRKRGMVSRGNPRPGDLIVWTKKSHIAHIGIYMYGNRAISALTSGVRTHSVGGLDTRFKAYLHVSLNR
jgi:cell wall-associated NlpC family hydrolase